LIAARAAPAARERFASDARVVAGLLGVLLVLTIISWRRWGIPSFDAGLDLTVADGITRGEVPYRDLRYFYGPAGVYSLAAMFAVFGTSLTVAFAFGFAVTLTILVSFYVLARQWLSPLTAGLCTLLLMTIAFSGTFFDYVLPHTNAGTFGCLFLILELLALVRRRHVLAGCAAGILLLTRPEFAAFAGAVALGGIFGQWRDAGPREAARLAALLILPALAFAGIVYGALASAAGWNRLFFENIVPIDFARISGGRLQGGWAPFTFSSAVALAARGALVAVPALALAATLATVPSRHGARARLNGLWPLAAAVGGLAAAWVAWRLLGVFPDALEEVEDEAVRLLAAMAWLPVPALGLLVWALVRLRRGAGAPWRDWTADLALLAGAAAAGLRAYNEFTTDSYAPYYAALPVLAAGVLVATLARPWPAWRPAGQAVLACAAAGLVLHAYIGLYSDDTVPVSTPRGDYRWYPDGGPAVEQTVRYIDRHTAPEAPILVVPSDPGIHFLSGRPPALYESTFLPGTLDSESDERAAVRRLRRVRPALVVFGAQLLQNYGVTEIGKDYNRILGDYLRRDYRPVERFGDVESPVSDNLPARAFTVWERRP
jgi:hypothetical protein